MFFLGSHSVPASGTQSFHLHNGSSNQSHPRPSLSSWLPRCRLGLQRRAQRNREVKGWGAPQSQEHPGRGAGVGGRGQGERPRGRGLWSEPRAAGRIRLQARPLPRARPAPPRPAFASKVLGARLLLPHFHSPQSHPLRVLPPSARRPLLPWMPRSSLCWPSCWLRCASATVSAPGDGGVDRRQAPDSVRGHGSSAPARAVPSEPNPRRFAPGRSRQPTSRGALPRRAAFEVPSVAPPALRLALRCRARVPGRVSCRQTSGGLQSEVGQDNWVRARPGRFRSRRGRARRCGAESGAAGPWPLTIHLPASAFPRPSSVSRVEWAPGSVRGHGCSAPARAKAVCGSCWRERFAKPVWHRDLLVVAMRSGAAARRPSQSYRSEQLSGLRRTPGCASVPQRGPQRRGEAGSASRQCLPCLFLGSPRRGPGAIRVMHAPAQPPKHTCRLAPLSPDGRALLCLGVSAAAKFNHQGFRPWGKVVYRFTERERAFFLLRLKRNLTVLLQDTTAANQNKLLPLNTQNKPCQHGQAMLSFLGCEVSNKSRRGLKDTVLGAAEVCAGPQALEQSARCRLKTTAAFSLAGG